MRKTINKLGCLIITALMATTVLFCLINKTAEKSKRENAYNKAMAEFIREREFNKTVEELTKN